MSKSDTAKPPRSASYRGIDWCDRCGVRLGSGEWLGGLCKTCEKRQRPRSAHAPSHKGAKTQRTRRATR